MKIVIKDPRDFLLRKTAFQHPLGKVRKAFARVKSGRIDRHPIEIGTDRAAVYAANFCDMDHMIDDVVQAGNRFLRQLFAVEIDAYRSPAARYFADVFV